MTINLTPYPGAPTLADIITARITNPALDLDCLILITGKKGSGKSIFSLNLAYQIAVKLSKIHNKPWQQFFNMDHVKSCDPSGTFEMFTGETLRTENSVLIADDIAISYNARNAMTTTNKQLSQVITVSRVYRNCLILNCVSSSHVDKIARSLADIVIDVIGVHIPTRQSIAKVYLFETAQHTGKEYRRFLTYHKKRIKYFLCGLPPADLMKDYKALRMAKTNELIQKFSDGTPVFSRAAYKTNERAKTKASIMASNREKVLALKAQGLSYREISRRTGLSDYRINQCLATSNPTPIQS